MVAPNGAHKQKSDHNNLPLSLSEIVQTAIDCTHAGANGIHVHVRDFQSKHCLDAGLYKEIIMELSQKTPELLVQITTEAVGMYSPEQQRQLVYDVMPAAVSVSLNEMISDDNHKQAASFYHWAKDCDIDLQHILYSARDVLHMDQLIDKKTIPNTSTSCLYVLGRYVNKQQSSPEDLTPFLQARSQSKHLNNCRFMACAFGFEEINCLTYAAQQGGNCRIGFENNMMHSNERIAKDNAERVIELVKHLKTHIRT